jgi:hypothetical protein
MITELRRYRIRPERMDSWVAAFRTAARENERHGIRVEYAGIDREASTFVWLRSFEDEGDRVARKDAFYGSDWWLERETMFMDHVLEYDVVFLDADLVRDGSLVEAGVPHGERPGSHLDGPPDGWTRSNRATFVPEPVGREGSIGQD